MTREQITKSVPDEETWGDEIQGQGGGSLVTWDEEKIVIGNVTGYTEVANRFKEGEMQRRYDIETDEGEFQFFAPAGLDSKLREITLPAFLRIEFTGRTIKTDVGRRMKQFSVRQRAS